MPQLPAARTRFWIKETKLLPFNWHGTSGFCQQQAQIILLKDGRNMALNNPGYFTSSPCLSMR